MNKKRQAAWVLVLLLVTVSAMTLADWRREGRRKV